jgi:small subunit ribosomal protein S20
MPHIESAKRRLRQNRKRRIQNRAVLSDLRTQIKKVLQAVKSGNADAAKVELSQAYKRLDKCALRRYLHPNTAYRYKSRLARRVNGLKPAAPAASV